MNPENGLPLLRVGNTSSLEAVVERIIFHNATNGYTVLKVVPQKSKIQDNQSAQKTRFAENIVCVGHMIVPKVGVHIRFQGNFVKNPRYGRQFQFESLEEILPSSSGDIQQYLGSGLIKGIGQELAARIVKFFGENTISILDNEPEKLLQIHGIGEKTCQRIKKSWNEHRGMRDLHLFLQPYGISASYAIKIYKAYGGEAAAVVKSNPFRLAMDIHGIGFLTADEMAAKMGFARDHPLRAQAATLYALQKAADDGHVFLREELLVKSVCDQLGVGESLVTKAIDTLVHEQRLVRELLHAPNPEEETISGVYLSRFHHCESRIAFYLKRLMTSPKTVLFKNPSQLLNNIVDSLPIQLAAGQIRAIETSMRSKVLIVTGGPGTGKTTIINAIIKVFEACSAKILLAAPTGRAAKRMSEATEKDAKTIHRLLEYSPKEDRFGRNEDNPLACGLLVVDEASMMDTLLFYHLLKAVPLGATVILVGDVHQLPSVGPGNVLSDIISSGTLPVVELNEIFRQSAESEIICSAHLINCGKMPIMENRVSGAGDFYFIPKDDPDEAADLIVELIKNHIPRRFGYDAINEVQLLTPMHKGAVGSENMNARLQQSLNPNALELIKGNRSFRLHDKVMQIRNNYDKDIFNGDIGRIVYMDIREKKISVNFDGIVMPYEFEELDELTPAYAISIHKAQGSEYPAVVIPVMMQHYMLLQRNLVYTGITRGKKLVIIVGERRALQIAIKNNKTCHRNTWLAGRLQDFQ